MKTQLALISLLALAGTFLFFQQSTLSLQTGEQDTILFEKWQKKHNFQYTSTSEYSYRFAVFQENLRYVESHNASNSHLVLGMTKFAAMTNQEFSDLVSSKQTTESQDIPIVHSSESVENAPPSFNWVTEDAVTPVQDQGVCAASWAFSAVSTFESMVAVNFPGILFKFSEQQLISCINEFGCNQGDTLNAFSYISLNGITSDESYPYAQLTNPQTPTCTYNPGSGVTLDIGLAQLPPLQTYQMQTQLLQQPLSAQINTGSTAFQLYTSGVITQQDGCGNYGNEYVSIVGYNNQHQTPYWIVKNSWGTSWGQQGYVWIQNSYGNGVCGINNVVNYPIYYP